MKGVKHSKVNIHIYKVTMLKYLPYLLIVADARLNTKIGTWFDSMKNVVGEREGKILL